MKFLSRLSIILAVVAFKYYFLPGLHLPHFASTDTDQTVEAPLTSHSSVIAPKKESDKASHVSMDDLVNSTSQPLSSTASNHHDSSNEHHVSMDDAVNNSDSAAH